MHQCYTSSPACYNCWNMQWIIHTFILPPWKVLQHVISPVKMPFRKGYCWICNAKPHEESFGVIQHVTANCLFIWHKGDIFITMTMAVTLRIQRTAPGVSSSWVQPALHCNNYTHMLWMDYPKLTHWTVQGKSNKMFIHSINPTAFLVLITYTCKTLNQI